MTAIEERRRFMCSSKDPTAVYVRLFGSSVDVAKLKHEDVRTMFEAYGKVWDVALFPTYFFVQYDNEQSSEKAIQELNGKIIDGKVLNLKYAAKDRQHVDHKAPITEICRFYSIGNCSKPDCKFRHETPGNSLIRQQRDREPARQREADRYGEPRRSRWSSPGPARAYNRDADFENFYATRSQMEQPVTYPVASQAPSVVAAPPSVDLRPPYDCVVITGSELQRNYCMAVEQRLVSFGMLTNIQVVTSELLFKKAVEEAARHTVPYTICITQQNEEHRSVTLNILHGVAQEHRNMPLDDAMHFLERNFDTFVDLMKKKISAVNEWVQPTVAQAHLLKSLADGRVIAYKQMKQVEDYVKVLKQKALSIDSITNPSLLKEASPPRRERRPADHLDTDRARERERDRERERNKERDLKRDRDRLDRPTRRDRILPVQEPARRGSRSDAHEFGLPPPKAAKTNFKPSGTMQDLVRSSASANRTSSSRAENGTSSASGINFDNPAVKRALSELISSTDLPGNNETQRWFA